MIEVTIKCFEHLTRIKISLVYNYGSITMCINSKYQDSNKIEAFVKLTTQAVLSIDICMTGNA